MRATLVEQADAARGIAESHQFSFSSLTRTGAQSGSGKASANSAGIQ